MPVTAGADTAFSLMLGLVCERCDTYNEPGSSRCTLCGEGLIDSSGPTGAAPAPPPLGAAPTPWAARPAPGFPLPTLTPLPGGPPSWLTAPTGRPIPTAAAMPRVDLADVTKSGSSPGLVPPSDLPGVSSASLPIPAPPVSPAPSVSPALADAPLASRASVSSSLVRSQTAPKTKLFVEDQACPRCRVAVSSEDRFCRSCGTRIENSQPTMQTSLPTVPAPDLTPQPTAHVVRTLRDEDPVITAPQPAVAVGATPSQVFGAPGADRSARLILVRGHSTFGYQWRMQAGELVVGRARGAVLFPDDAHLAETHCRLVFKDDDLWLEPADTTNGVFVRMRENARLRPGDEVVIGAERLRLLSGDERHVDPRTQRTDTGFFGSPVKESTSIALMRIFDDPRFNETFVRTQRALTIGRSSCDINFPNDGFVSERHATLRQQSDHVLLEDNGSRNGTYVRVRLPRRLYHGDILLLGEQVLRVELAGNALR